MSKDGEGANDVGIKNRRGPRCTSPLSETRGVRTCDSDSIAQADGRPMLPEVLRPVTSEGISTALKFSLRLWVDVLGLGTLTAEARLRSPF